MDAKSKSILGATQSHLPEDGEWHKANLGRVGRLRRERAWTQWGGAEGTMRVRRH